MDKINCNKMTRHFKIQILFLLLSLGWINGQSYASFAGSFLRMGSSARSMAMGSAFTAEIDQGFAAYHNPASMVFLSKRQMGFSHHVLPLDRRFTATNFSTPLPPGASLGLAWISAGVDKIDGRTGSGQHTQYLSTSEDAFMISFAQKLFPWFSAGINVKILRHQLPINEVDLSGKGIGMDFGIFVQTNSGANLAFMIQDLNSRYQWKTDKIFEQGKVYAEQFPTIYRLGTTLQYNDFYIVGDGGVLMNASEVIGYTVRLGTEYQYLDNYYLRAGLGNRRMSVGVGLDWSFLKENDARLDYAFVFENPAGAAHIFTYAISF